MNSILKQKLDRAFELTHDLYESLDDSVLDATISNLPSNSLRSQAWCIIGARESYTKAIKAGSWQGFTCSIEKAASKDAILSALRACVDALDTIDFDALNKDQINTAFDLLEHEIQHHGQLIRYMYANKFNFPKSWNERYTV